MCFKAFSPFFFLLLILIFVPTSYAQTIYQSSQTLNVNIGNPPTANKSFVSVAQAITSNLSRCGAKGDSCGSLYDQFNGHRRGTSGSMTLSSSVQSFFPGYKVSLRLGLPELGPKWRYWCTDLIIDTYNIVFGKRIIGEEFGTVQSQVQFWKTENNNPKNPRGFSFAHYSTDHKGALLALNNTGPGGPIFWESVEGFNNGLEHVGLIKDITLNKDPKTGSFNGTGSITTYEANGGHTSWTYPIRGWQVKNVPFPVVGFGLYDGTIGK